MAEIRQPGLMYAYMFTHPGGKLLLWAMNSAQPVNGTIKRVAMVFIEI